MSFLTRRFSRLTDALLGGRDVQAASVKVPLQITLLFWVIKIVSTAMGEALADWLDGPSNVIFAGLGALIALGGLVVALRAQFRTTHYRPSVYWFAVAMVATFGTMAADVWHQFLGAPYWSTTLLYALILALVFRRWWVHEGTLSIHSINRRSREKFYWGTVLATFALGTATGDWTAGSLHLNFLPSGILFAAIIVIPAVAYWFGANSVVMFWFAYVITRPLGASFADYMDYPRNKHGLGIAHPIVWGSLAAVMIILVAVSALVDSAKSAKSDAGTTGMGTDAAPTGTPATAGAAPHD